MAKKNETGNRVVYSTNPEFKLDDDQQQEEETLAPASQKLKVRLDTKQRAGKAVTLVEGFIGKREELEDL